MQIISRLMLILPMLVGSLMPTSPMPKIEISFLIAPTECSDTFIAHDLDHVTSVPGGADVRMFESNGTGVGIHDLDNDGDLDIVLANHAGSHTLLWNQGNLTFRTERMNATDGRGVNLIDFDGDGWVDIFLTRTASAPNLWLNQGDGTFVRQVIDGLAEPLYTTSWADLDGDGDLDLVGGSYDAALLNEFGQDFLMNSRGGVFYYEQYEQRLSPRRLHGEAQALALVLADVNRDMRLDILVGNDFAVPDYTWLNTAAGWQPVTPFASTSHSTMSLDLGDIDNDGLSEVFATDMKPYTTSNASAWQPILDSAQELADQSQIMANTLQMTLGNQYTNVAADRGIAATGWSWSGKFGDLDQDGYLDLYVVNGMIEQRLFTHLPDHELREENQAFRNNGLGIFQPRPEWSLGSTRSGRGMSMGDLDGDGDLDIVVNNLRGTAQLFENQLCGGSSLLVDLRWPGSGNAFAIGAAVTLMTDQGALYRDVRAASGYLSADPAQIHFGFGEDTQLRHLEVEWPDQIVTRIDDLKPHTRLIITRP